MIAFGWQNKIMFLFLLTFLCFERPGVMWACVHVYVHTETKRGRIFQRTPSLNGYTFCGRVRSGMRTFLKHILAAALFTKQSFVLDWEGKTLNLHNCFHITCHETVLKVTSFSKRAHLIKTWGGNQRTEIPCKRCRCFSNEFTVRNVCGWILPQGAQSKGWGPTPPGNAGVGRVRGLLSGEAEDSKEHSGGGLFKL